LGYANVREALAEKLNPDASFSEAGEEIIAANILNDNKSPSAARIDVDVDKNRQAVKVYSDRGVPDVQFVAY
jgi:hypothetical protein